MNRTIETPADMFRVVDEEPRNARYEQEHNVTSFRLLSGGRLEIMLEHAAKKANGRRFHVMQHRVIIEPEELPALRRLINAD